MMTRFINDSRHRFAVVLAVVASLLALVAGGVAAAAGSLDRGEIATGSAWAAVGFAGVVLVCLGSIAGEQVYYRWNSRQFTPENKAAARRIGARWRRVFPQAFKAQAPKVGDSAAYPSLVHFAQLDDQLQVKIRKPHVIEQDEAEYLEKAAEKLAVRFDFFDVKPSLNREDYAWLRVVPVDQTQAARSWARA